MSKRRAAVGRRDRVTNVTAQDAITKLRPHSANPLTRALRARPSPLTARCGRCLSPGRGAGERTLFSNTSPWGEVGRSPGEGARLGALQSPSQQHSPGAALPSPARYGRDHLPSPRAAGAASPQGEALESEHSSRTPLPWGEVGRSPGEGVRSTGTVASNMRDGPCQRRGCWSAVYQVTTHKSRPLLEPERVIYLRRQLGRDRAERVVLVEVFEVPVQHEEQLAARPRNPDEPTMNAEDLRNIVVLEQADPIDAGGKTDLRGRAHHARREISLR